MASRIFSVVGSALKSQDLTLGLEIPLGRSDCSNCSPSISLGPVSIPLRTSTRLGPISGVFTSDSLTGSTHLQPTTGDPDP